MGKGLLGESKRRGCFTPKFRFGCSSDISLSGISVKMHLITILIERSEGRLNVWNSASSATSVFRRRRNLIYLFKLMSTVRMSILPFVEDVADG